MSNFYNKLSFFSLLLLSCLLLSSNWVTAQKTKKQLEQQKKALYKEIAVAEKLLKETKTNQQSSVNDLAILERQISVRSKVINNILEQVGMLETRISTTESQVDSLATTLEVLKTEYAGLVQQGYVNQNEFNRLLFIFSARDFNDAYRRVKYMQYYREFRKNQVFQIQSAKDSLESKLNALADERAEQVRLLQSEQNERQILEEEKRNKDDLVRILRKKEKQLQKKLTKKEESLKILDNEIRAIIAKANRSATSPTKTDTSPEAIKLSKSFASNKGGLPWPVKEGVITGKFGKNRHPVLKNIYTNNNGIDINTKNNAYVNAVFHGKVSNILFNPSFQWAVIVKHGNYFSVYANLEEVLVVKGDVVQTGQEVGRVFYDSSENKNEVHLEIWEGNQKLNPLNWIGKQ